MKGVDTFEACGRDGVSNRIIRMCSDGFHVYFTRFTKYIIFTWPIP